MFVALNQVVKHVMRGMRPLSAEGKVPVAQEASQDFQNSTDHCHRSEPGVWPQGPSQERDIEDWPSTDDGTAELSLTKTPTSFKRDQFQTLSSASLAGRPTVHLQIRPEGKGVHGLNMRQIGTGMERRLSTVFLFIFLDFEPHEWIIPLNFQIWRKEEEFEWYHSVILKGAH